MDNQRQGTIGAWLPIIGCMLTMTAVSGLSMSGLGVVVPEWIKTFSLSSGQVMLVLTAISLLSGLFGICIGALMGRFAPRTILACGVVCSALAMLAASQAHTYTALVLGMVPLAGLGNALTGPVVGQSLAVGTFKRPGLAIGVVSMGMAFGAIVGPPILALLIAQQGWQSAMTTSAAIIAVLGAVAIVSLVGRVRLALPERGPGEANEPGIGTVSASSIALSRAFIGAILFQFPLMALMAGSFFHLGLNFAELGGDVTQAAGVMALASFIGLAGTFLAGWLVDRVSLVIMQVAIVAIMGVAHVMLTFTPSIMLLPVAIVLLSLGNSFLYPLIPAVFARCFPSAAFARAIGMFQPILFGSILGALILGVMHDMLGSYPATYMLLLPLFVPVMLGMVLLSTALGSARKAAPAEVSAAGMSGL